MRKLMGLAAFAGGAACMSMTAATEPLGNETVNYSYDALGRLTGSTTTGGPSDTWRTNTCFDAAGNRLRYDAATSPVGACPSAGSTPTPTPTPTPAPSGSPPVAVADAASIPCLSGGTVNLTANDTDPDNDYPLTLVSITCISGTATASALNSTSVSVITNGKGPSVFAYTVKDATNASSVGQLTITATGTALYCSGGGGG